MNTPSNSNKSRSRQTSTATAPVSTPEHYGQHDHSFTLQAIMEMQKTLGSLCEKTDAISKRIEGFDKRLETVESTVSGMSHKMYAAGILLVIALALGGFIVDKAWDLVVDQLKPKVEESIKK